MLFIRSIDQGRLIETVWDAAPTDAKLTDKAIWYDLFEPTLEERAYVNQRAHVNIPSREDMEEIELSSRLYNQNGAEYMTATIISRIDESLPVKTPVLFVLSPSALVSVRYTLVRPFVNVVERLAKAEDPPPADPQALMLALIDALVDRLADALELAADKIDVVSRGVFAPPTPGARKGRDRDLQGTIESLGRSGELLGSLRESLLSLNRLVGYHAGRTALDRENAEAQAHLVTIQRDVAALSDHATYLGAKVSFLLDASLGLINLEQNQIIKIFSIAAVCLMPPTLIASIYGMNFKTIPELSWDLGYPLALSLMVITGIAPFVYFKRRGWL